MDDANTTATSTPEIPPGAVAASGARNSPLPATATSDTLQPPTANLSLLSASARTSYTRVDLAPADVPGVSENLVAAEGIAQTQEGDCSGHDQLQEPQGVEPVVPHEPQVSLTFLLVSGKRKTLSYDAETTIVRVKELVWNAWPSEWQDERPPSPSYFRLLYLGKILQDDDTLTKVGFPTHIPPSTQASRPMTPPPSTIVHLSIRAYAPPGSEDAPKKKGRRRRNDSGGAPDENGLEDAGCCSSCVIC